MMRPAPTPPTATPRTPPPPTPRTPPTPTPHPSATGLRERRRRLLVWSALPALLVLCLSAKLLSLGMLADTAARTFAAGDSGGVADAAAGLRIANFIDPHKAPFAEGDGLFLAGDFAAARQRFEEALSLPGQADECVVRVNLALTIERLGDAQAKAEDPTAAARLFAEGVAVVEAAPEGCFDAGEAPGQDAGEEAGPGEKLEQAGERLQGKADAAAADNTGPQPSEQPGGDEPAADPGQQSQLEQLKDSAKEAQNERNSGQQRDEYLRDDDFGPGVDRPW